MNRVLLAPAGGYGGTIVLVQSISVERSYLSSPFRFTFVSYCSSNCLNFSPSIIRSSQTSDRPTYRKHLKSHLFQSALNSSYSDQSSASDSFYCMITALNRMLLLTYLNGGDAGSRHHYCCNLFSQSHHTQLLMQNDTASFYVIQRSYCRFPFIL